MSDYIYGLHEPGGEYLFAESGVDGWIVYTHELGHDPTANGGLDYSIRDGTPIARLNNGYNPNGTIPKPEFYEDFAKRLGRWVNLSLGCSRWIIGNEPNHIVEWPEGQSISADEYAICYMLCRNEIHQQYGHEGDEVLLAAIAPWFAQIEGWIEYFNKIQLYVWQHGGDIDGFALHAYTHGSNPELITSEQTMDPPYEDERFQFRVYRDWVDNILPKYQEKPLYITETDQNQPWLDQNNGWVKAAYREIDEYNQARKNKVRCLCLYRWPDYDQYGIEKKSGVISDFRDAMAEQYKWKESSMADLVVYSDGFEDGFPAYNGEGELMVAQGWRPEWLEDEGNDTVLNRPEYKPAGTAQIRTGQGAQAIHSSYSTVDGAITKVFTVEEGRQYQVSVWGMGITGSGAQPKMGILLGVNQGEVSGYDGEFDIVSEWWSQDVPGWGNDIWKQLITPVFTAQYSKITVSLRFVTNFAIPANAHFDDFQIVAKDGGVVPPPPDGDIAKQLLTIADAQLALSVKIRNLASQVGGGSMEAKDLIGQAEEKLAQAKAIL